MKWPKNWEEWSQFAQAFALIAAACYFLLKLLLGYIMSNMTIVPAVQRTHFGHESEDTLVLTLKITKGDREAINLEHVTIDIYDARLPRTRESEPIQTIKRDFEIREERRPGHPGPPLRVTPGEGAQFSYLIHVPRDMACELDVTIVGGAGYFGLWSAHWLVSTVSLPLQASPASAKGASKDNAAHATSVRMAH